MDKDWDDMTLDEKADYLHLKLEDVISHMDDMFKKMDQRLSAIEGTPT